MKSEQHHSGSTRATIIGAAIGGTIAAVACPPLVPLGALMVALGFRKGAKECERDFEKHLPEFESHDEFVLASREAGARGGEVEQELNLGEHLSPLTNLVFGGRITRRSRFDFERD